MNQWIFLHHATATEEHKQLTTLMLSDNTTLLANILFPPGPVTPFLSTMSAGKHYNIPTFTLTNTKRDF